MFGHKFQGMLHRASAGTCANARELDSVDLMAYGTWNQVGQWLDYAGLIV